LVADYEQPINTEIMKAVASRVTEKSDVLLLTAVDMDDSGPYEIAEPRVITALETYTPSCKFNNHYTAHPFHSNTSTGLQTPRLKRLAEIVSAQAMAQQEKIDNAAGVGSIDEDEDQEHAEDNEQVVELDAEENVAANGV
jgi:myosin-5